jgi:hypothetical protein
VVVLFRQLIGQFFADEVEDLLGALELLHEVAEWGTSYM